MFLPYGKKHFDELLTALGFIEAQSAKKVEIDMSTFEKINHESTLASDIVRKKLYKYNGSVQISLLDGTPCYVYASPDGVSFTSDKLLPPKFLPVPNHWIL